MKQSFLPSLIGLAAWAGIVHGQATLGIPVTSSPPCESCNHAPALVANHGDCRTNLCQTGMGQLANSLMAPIRLATGNLLPPCCTEVVRKEDVARMIADGGYSQAELIAVKIKLDESQAQARRKAVRYLATVNCHYYPEVESGLIAALRADRNECVRYEAALALATCQCLTSRIVDALCISAMGCETDGNPGEISPRVRNAAQAVLNRCLALGSPLPTTSPPQMLPPADWTPPPPVQAAPMPANLDVPGMTQPANFNANPATETISADLLNERNRAETVGVTPRPPTPSTGQRNLFQLLLNATKIDPSPPAQGGVFPARVSPASPAVPLPPVSASPPAPSPLGLAPIGAQLNMSIPRQRPPAYNE